MAKWLARGHPLGRGAGDPGAGAGWRPDAPPRRPADCLLMLAYRDRAERAKGLRERSSLTLEDICGLEPGLAYEGLAHTLAVVCLSQAVMLGFDSREAMCAWDARIRHALGEGECPAPGPGRSLHPCPRRPGAEGGGWCSAAQGTGPPGCTPLSRGDE